MALVEVRTDNNVRQGTAQTETITPTQATRSGTESASVSSTESSPQTTATRTVVAAAVTTQQSRPYHAGLAFKLRIPIKPRQTPA